MKKIILLITLLIIAGCVTPSGELDNTTWFPSVGRSTNVEQLSQVSYGGLYQFFDFIGSEPSEYQDGAHQVIPWNNLEPTIGNYNWTELNNYVADRAQHGLHIGLGFNTTDYSPYACAAAGGTQCWTSGNREDLIRLPSDALSISNENIYYVVCPLSGTQPSYRLPKYWSTQYLTIYENFVNALATQIINTPNLVNNIDWIELPIGVYGELNPGVSQSAACLQNLGLSQALWETIVISMIDMWVDAFDGSGIDLSFQGTNYYIAKDTRERMNDYAASQGLGLQHAKWHPDWEDMVVACTSCWSRGKGMVDAILRWENQTSFAIEQPDPPIWGAGSRTTLNHAEEDYWNLAAFLDLKGDIYKVRLTERGTLKRLTTENVHVQDMIQVFSDLAGTDEDNAPYAITWMRETEWSWWPKCNNFGFYLRASTAQEPSPGGSCPGISQLTTDGQAVAVFNLDQTYAPGTCPNDRIYSTTCDPRYRYARQTTSSHPYIYFDVDYKYMYNTGVNATIEIDYLNTGTNQIKFQWYQSGVLQTESLTKTNTNQWQTWTLNLTNMDITDPFTSNNTTWDFRLWDNGDGVETIHSLKFEPMTGGTPVATPTSVATATPTPTPIPGATPTPILTPQPTPTLIPMSSYNVCVDWNNRDGCNTNDHFVEIFNISGVSLRNYRIVIGSCSYTIRDDVSITTPLILFADMMGCPGFPQNGTVFLFNSSGVLVDARTYIGTIVFGHSWQPESIFNSSGAWEVRFPTPGR
jgi:hypothetical protein